MHTETLTYEADGLRMESHLYVDDPRGGPRPGVLVFPEAFGLGDHARSRAERLAALGYVALACDLHGQGKVYDALDTVMGLIGPLRDDPQRTRARARAAWMPCSGGRRSSRHGSRRSAIARLSSSARVSGSGGNCRRLSSRVGAVWLSES